LVNRCVYKKATLKNTLQISKALVRMGCRVVKLRSSKPHGLKKTTLKNIVATKQTHEAQAVEDSQEKKQRLK
jgi:hypothetical protein